MQLPKDVYLYLADFGDDRTIIEMLSVNKTFNDPRFFYRIFNKRYPQLIQFKKPNEDWKQFYLRMTHYIFKLKEEINFDYLPAPSLNPENFYREMKYFKERRPAELIQHLAVRTIFFAAEIGDLDTIFRNDDFIQDKSIVLEYIVNGAARSGNLKIYQMFEKRFGEIFEDEISRVTMKEAALSGNMEMMEYIQNKLLSKGYSINGIVEAAIEGAAELGDLNLIQHFESLSSGDEDVYHAVIGGAIAGGHLEILKHYLSKVEEDEDEDFYDGYIESASEYGQLEILRYLIEEKYRGTTKNLLSLLKGSIITDPNVLAYVQSLKKNIKKSKKKDKKGKRGKKKDKKEK